jgi:hypothetical protein
VPESLHYAKQILEAIVVDLGKMGQIGQELETDALDGEQSGLVKEIMGLLGHSTTLLEHIGRAIIMQESMGRGAGVASGADEEPEEEDKAAEAGRGDDSANAQDDDVAKTVQVNEDEPLNRDEIARLLICVAKALSLQIITQAQRGFLKDQIIARHGMLRVILQFPTLDGIMMALQTVSSSVVDA